MRQLKLFCYLFAIGIFVWGCGLSPVKSNLTKEEPVVIANDSLEYEIIIIDIGFTSYLNSVAKPISYHSQNYLENKNIFYVINWNIRARNPARYNPNIYENVIDYDPEVDYGLEVNYKLYWYFKFAEEKYRMSLR